MAHSLVQYMAFALCSVLLGGCEAERSDQPTNNTGGLAVTQQYLGSGLGADALSNTRIGGPYGTTTSIGFRAEHSGLLASMRMYVIWSATSSVYNGGTGGSLLIKIQPDDGTSHHRPSGQTLGTFLHTDPMNKGNFPLMVLSSPVQLRRGMVYHVVITNPDADPAANYVSVNSLWTRTATVPPQQTLPDSDWFQLQGSGKDPSAWVSITAGKSDSYTPILELNYMEGFSQGVGYMEVWGENPKVVSGAKAVRQLFTMLAADQNVARASIRLRRLSGTDSLVAEIRSDSGTTVARGAVPASRVGTSYAWVDFPMGNQRLDANKKYTLELRCAAGSTFDLYPIRKGSEGQVAFRSALFVPGYAQFTTGGAWTGWDQWGQPDRHDGDLQYYLTFTSDPPVASTRP